MNAKPRKVGEIADALGVVPNTIRNYCRRYPSYLSASANPPSNGMRLFTTRDFNVLAFIHNAVNEGLNHDEISMQLAEKSFNSDGVDLIVGLAEVMPVEETPKPQEGPEAPLLVSSAISDLQARMRAMERARALQEHKLEERERRWARLEGAVIALLAGGFVLWIWYLVSLRS